VQVTPLTTYIEDGFQRNLKTGAIFLDLTAAYNTIWHTGLLAKLTGSLPSWFVSAVELLLRNRRFRVHMGDKTSAVVVLTATTSRVRPAMQSIV